MNPVTNSKVQNLHLIHRYNINLFLFQNRFNNLENIISRLVKFHHRRIHQSKHIMFCQKKANNYYLNHIICNGWRFNINYSFQYHIVYIIHLIRNIHYLHHIVNSSRDLNIIGSWIDYTKYKSQLKGNNYFVNHIACKNQCHYNLYNLEYHTKHINYFTRNNYYPNHTLNMY